MDLKLETVVLFTVAVMTFVSSVLKSRPSRIVNLRIPGILRVRPLLVNFVDRPPQSRYSVSLSAEALISFVRTICISS